MAMKVRIQRTSASTLLARDIAAYPDRVKLVEAHADSIARVKAQLRACSDKAAHIARIKVLKAQVDAGTYIVDSRALAQKMQALPVMGPLPAYEKNDVSLSAQEDEPHK